MNTHHYRLKNSKRHGGELITRVPVSYLKWMSNNNHSESVMAKAELERRGTVTPTLEVSGHAIDRASLMCLSLWRQRERVEDGLHAWLCRLASEALAQGQEKNGKISHAGMLFAFEMDCEWPVLKTVMPANGK